MNTNWVGARGYSRREIAADDKRDPMTRLLIDCNNPVSGQIEVNYAAQWKTVAKASRLGYIDDRQRLTDKGRAFVAKMKARAA